MNTISNGLVATASFFLQWIPSGKTLDTEDFDRYLDSTKENGKPELDRLKVHKWGEFSAIGNGLEYLRLIQIAAYRALHNELNIRYQGEIEADKLASKVEILAKDCFERPTSVALGTLKSDVKKRLLKTPFFTNAQKNGSNDIQGLYLRTFSQLGLAECLRFGTCGVIVYKLGSDNLLATAITAGLLYYGWISLLVPDAHHKLKEGSLVNSHKISLSDRNRKEIVLNAKETMGLDNEEAPALLNFKGGLANLDLYTSIESPFQTPKSIYLNPGKPSKKKKNNPASAKDWNAEMDAALDQRDTKALDTPDWYKWDAKANEYAKRYYKSEIDKLDPNDPKDDATILGYKIEWEKAEADRLESRILSMGKKERNDYIGSKISELQDRAKADKPLRETIQNTIDRLNDLTVVKKKKKHSKKTSKSTKVTKLNRRRAAPAPASSPNTTMSLSASESDSKSESDSDS